MGDPATVSGSEDQQRKALLRTYTELSHRIGLLVNLPVTSADRMALRERLEQIGRAST